MRNFFNQLFRNIRKIFSGYNLLWHFLAGTDRIMRGNKIWLKEGLSEKNFPLILKWFRESEVVQYFSFAKRALALKNIDELKILLKEIETGPVFEIYCKDTFIGYTSLSSIREKSECEFTIFILDKNYWGKGVSGEATVLTLSYAFDELEMSKVTLDTSEFHQRAIKFYEKAGFRRARLISKDRTIFHDGKWN